MPGAGIAGTGGEVEDILDDEASKGEGKPKEKASPPETAPGQFSADALDEREEVNWDASFQREFEKEPGEVVTPSKKKEDLFYSVPAVTQVAGEQLFQQNAVRAADAFGDAAGVFVLTLQHFAPSLVMRGLTGRRLRLLFDGIPLGSLASPSGPDYLAGLVDLPSLESIEVVGGPAAALYGTGALGGVVNFMPRQPPLNPFLPPSFSSKVSFHYDTTDSTKLVHGGFSLHAPRTGITAGVTYGDAGNLNSSREKQSLTGFDNTAFSFTAARLIAPSHQLKMHYSFTNVVEAGRQAPGGLTKEYVFWPSYERHLLYWRFTAAQLPLAEQLEVTAGIHLHKERQKQHFATFLDSPESYTEKSLATSLFALVAGRSNTGSWGSLLYGIDCAFDRLSTASSLTESVAPETTVTRPIARGTFERSAEAGRLEPYAAWELYPLHPVLLSVSGRLTYDWLGSGLVDREHFVGGALQAEARIPFGIKFKKAKVATLSDLVSMSLGFSYVSRPPSLDELTAVRAVPEGIVFGNPSLGNETYLGAQGGLKWSLGVLDGFLFYSYSRFQSMILPREAGPADLSDPSLPKAELCGSGTPCWAWENVGAADLHSIEFSSQAHIKGIVDIGATLAYTYGLQDTMTDDRESMSLVPPLHGAAWIRGTYKRFGLWGEVRLQWAWKQDRLSFRDHYDPGICTSPGGCRGTDSFAVLSIRGGVKITDRFNLSFSYHNLANGMYKTHGSLLYGPGVGAMISIEGKL